MIRLIFLVIFALFCTATFAAEGTGYGYDNTATDNTQVYHVYDDVDMISTVRFVYDRPHIVVKIIYPVLQSPTDNPYVNSFNQEVNNLVQQETGEFKDKVLEFKKSGDSHKVGNKNNFYIDYDTSMMHAGRVPILSVRFTFQGYIGGMAHPYHYHRVLNFDMMNGERLEMSGLFKPDSNYLSLISLYCKTVLSKRFGDTDMVTTGTLPTMDNFKLWNLKPRGLLITFDEYQVAPYVNGAQSVLIPYSVLKAIISPVSPIAACLRNRYRCLENNFLTGGFIDEAANSEGTPAKNNLALSSR